MLTKEQFKLEESRRKVTATYSEEFIKMLQKSGYGLNKKSGTNATVVTTRTWDTEYSVWNTKTRVLYTEDGKSLSEILPVINKQLDWICNNKVTIENKVVDDLITLKNTVWLNENEKPIDAVFFMSKLKLKSIFAMVNGSVDLCFTCDQLFLGHDLLLTIKSNGSIGQAELVG